MGKKNYVIFLLCLLILIKIEACKGLPKKPPIVIPQKIKKYPIKIEEPIIRVGLKVDADILAIKSNCDYQIILEDKGEIIAKEKDSVVYFVPKAREISKVSSYSLQIGAFSDKNNSDKLIEELKKVIEIKYILDTDVEKGIYKVKVKGFRDKDEALLWKSKLEAKGYSPWIIYEQSGKSISAGLQFYDEEGSKKGESLYEILVMPEGNNCFMIYENRPYRGGFEIFLNKRGRLNLINFLNLEDYLKGVVPLEMGPYTYSAIEALKAQALAARTYAIRNLGQYKDEGYDICSTTACQVYGGASVEDPLTNEAVEDTEGEIITYEGKPIIALYTSTCGGYTENGNYIFPHLNEPYLKAVPCSYEQLKIFTIGSSLRIAEIQDDSGKNITPEIFFMWKLNFLKEENLNSEYLNSSIEEKEWISWLKKLAIYLDINESQQEVMVPQNFLQAILAIAKASNLDEKARQLFHSVADETLMNFSDASIADLEAKKIIAFFITMHYLKPYDDDTLRLYDLPKRNRIIEVIYNILKNYRIFLLEEGEIINVKGDKVEIKKNKDIKEYEIAGDVLLARSYDNFIAITKELKIAVGDKVRFWVDKDRINYIEAVWSKQGSASDRSSNYSFWSEFIRLEKINEAANKIKRIGNVVDIVPAKYGESGRVIELLIKGEEGELILKGLNIRFLLGLRDNWFTVDKITGNPAGYLFIGRGWGHGVGLCQVGAYGMALQGKSYKEILKHYYTGVEIHKGF